MAARAALVFYKQNKWDKNSKIKAGSYKDVLIWIEENWDMLKEANKVEFSIGSINDQEKRKATRLKDKRKTKLTSMEQKRVDRILKGLE